MVAQIMTFTIVGVIGFVIWYFFPRIFACVALLAYMHATKQIPVESDPISSIFLLMFGLCLLFGLIFDICNIINGNNSNKKDSVLKNSENTRNNSQGGD